MSGPVDKDTPRRFADEAISPVGAALAAIGRLRATAAHRGQGRSHLPAACVERSEARDSACLSRFVAPDAINKFSAV